MRGRRITKQGRDRKRDKERERERGKERQKDEIFYFFFK